MTAPTPDKNPTAGTLVAERYQLIEVAGRGGMATVWKARIRGVLRPVAVKHMHPQLSSQPLYVAMFREEARVGQSLEHPNLLDVHQFVEEGGHYFLVTEWVDGVDLGTFIRQAVRRNRRTRWDMVAAIGLGLLRGLAAAHERVDENGTPAPIVHRDVSPHNILLSQNGVVKLVDFGLCLAWDRDAELTEPGIVKGKMSYLSPEVLQGRRPSPLSDQFAVGAVLWETLVGRKLFDGPSDFDVFRKIRDGVVEPLRPNRPDLSSPFISLVRRAIALEESARFPSLSAMAEDLAEVLGPAKDVPLLLRRAVRESRVYLDLDERAQERPDETPIMGIDEKTGMPEEQPSGSLSHRLKSLLGR